MKETFLLYYLALTALVTVAMQLSFFAIATARKIDTLTDFAGTLNFAIIAWLVYFLNGTHYLRQTLMTICVTMWAQRLGFFLLTRVIKRGRDARFDKIREDFWQFLGFWGCQIIWVWIVSLPVTMTNALSEDQPFSGYDCAGFVMWFLGFVIEAVADHQKDAQREIRDSGHQNGSFNGDTGLWYYSRHPNYFGEIVMWFGLYLCSCSVYQANGFSLGFLVGAISPLTTFILLAFFSGIPIAEATADKRYKDSVEYKQYKMRTSPLIPIPPAIYSLMPFAIRRLFFFEFDIYWKGFNRQ